MACFYSADRLRIYCLEFIERNLAEVKQSEYWDTLSTTEQTEIIQRATAFDKSQPSTAPSASAAASAVPLK